MTKHDNNETPRESTPKRVRSQVWDVTLFDGDAGVKIARVEAATRSRAITAAKRAVPTGAFAECRKIG